MGHKHALHSLGLMNKLAFEEVSTQTRAKCFALLNDVKNIPLRSYTLTSLQCLLHWDRDAPWFLYLYIFSIIQ
jgi:hypothetical protein